MVKEKTFLTTIFLMLNITLFSNTCDLIVLIKGFKNDAGLVRGVLYDSGKYFPDKHEFAVKKFAEKVTDTKLKIVVKDFSLTKVLFVAIKYSGGIYRLLSILVVLSFRPIFVLFLTELIFLVAGDVLLKASCQYLPG